MALTVNVKDFGIELVQEEKNKSIYLPLSAWKNLVACRVELEKALEDKKEGRWTLDEDKGLRVHTNSFQNKTYIHIRVWWNEKPTKRGLALHQDGWEILKNFLLPGLEMELGIEVMKTAMREQMKQKVFDECDGCVNSWASQRDHECLMDPELTSIRAMAKVSVLAADFIEDLAKEACKQNFILETPHETYKRIRLFHLRTIEKDLLKSCDSD